jgi:hypothetical protein
MKYTYVVFNGGIWHYVDAVNCERALAELKARGVKIVGAYKIYAFRESGIV